MDDRVEAMRILSAGNTIMILILGAILVLQVGLDYRSHRSSAFILGYAATPSEGSHGRRCCRHCQPSAEDALFRSLPICNYTLWSADVYFWEQGGQEYARRAELRELARLEKAEKEEAARSTSEKDKKE